MRLLACAIYDKQVSAFLPVFFVRAKGEAMRHFIDLMGDASARFSKHSGDYDLFHLFDFDDVSGRIVIPDGIGDLGPVPLLSGLDARATASAG